MKKFVFTTKLDRTDFYSNALSKLWGRKCTVINVLSVGLFFIEENGAEALVSDLDYVGFVNGYLRNKNLDSSSVLDHNRGCLELLGNMWPLPIHVAQSFSAIKITKDKVVLANDVVGFYPLYYSLVDNELIVSSHLIPFSHLRPVEVDKVGVLQRHVGPSYANFGRRTILKECHRLLPGELLEFELIPLQKGSSRFDNSLYQSMGSSDTKSLGQIAENLWGIISQEYKSALSPWTRTYIALSGGLDSRLALGAIPSGKEVFSLTYGSENLYEARIAKRLSEVVNAQHHCFQDYALYFPNKELMLRYAGSTESVGVASWFEILENIDPAVCAPILFGDMCEAIPARKIASMTSRNFRVREFLNKDLLSKDYLFTTSSEESFNAWKDDFRLNYLQKCGAQSKNGTMSGQLREEINSDLDLTFERIEQHHLPYQELYDELLDWHVHARIFMSKQMLINQGKFIPLNPMMSQNVLVAVSNIHPNLRLSYRLMDNLLKRVGDLKRFNHIPSAQSAFIPQSSPLFLKLLVWGARSKVDQLLIKRMMKAKNPSMRYRVVDFLNWPQIYQNIDGHRHIEEWFESDHVFDSCRVVDAFDRRKRLDSWPLENVDIVSLGGLNMELQLIKDFT